MTASMQHTATRYEVADVLQVKRHCVEDTELASFASAVRAFLRDLGSEAEDSYWRRVVARLRRVRWELATVPLPLTHEALELVTTSSDLERWLRDCNRIYPSHASAAADLIARIAGLAHSDRDPLGDKVIALQPGSEAVAAARALLIRDLRHAAAIAANLVHRGTRIDVMVPSQLASSSVCDRMIVAGPAAWFPQHVFSAPNARHIDLVHYAWIHDRGVETGILPVGNEGGARRGLLTPHGSQSHQALDAGDLAPVTDWSTITTRTGGRSDISDPRLDTVDAYLFLLASGDAVYLEAEEGSRAYVVDLNDDNELHQLSTGSIQAGSYLVTRVGGEGDYIPAIANTLLGSDAERLRASQQRWKDKLRIQIATAGLQAVARRIAEAGSPRVNEQNLRRWASPLSIRTSDFADFEAIMRVVALAADARQLWEEMARIDQAHLRAGQRVRALLNREIQNADMAELERSGWSDFDVAEIEGEGALRVARVEARAPGTVRISSRQTRQLVPVERDLWHG